MRIAATAGVVLAAWVGRAGAEKASPSHSAERRFEFTRMVAHWAEYGRPDYLDFIDEARPDLVQLGFYGGHFWSLAHAPEGKGYPAHFPVQGLAECADWFADKNRQLHQRGVKVVGHFNVTLMAGDPDGPKGPTGFFRFYRDLWDEKQLGPRPVADPLEFFEKDAAGKPLFRPMYHVGAYSACLRNPGWRTVLKAWVRRGIELGVDGFMVNYFYRNNCLCPHCQREFRSYLADRFTPQELRERLGIEDLARHPFTEIIAWHDPKESTPLRREMLRFSQISNKRAYDEVFIEYGRSLKPDLILGQWNHLGNFSQISGDERCLLPSELWGAGEDYLWYSAGGSAHFTDLENRFLGDVTLQCRYIRGAFDDKPFTIGKYEHTRIRAAIAELAANGGAPMGFYTNFGDPLARAEIARYYRFIERYNALYRGNLPHAECVLLYPRRRVHGGQVEAVESFRQLGRQLLDDHVLFDVLPDDLASPSRLAGYGQMLGDSQAAALDPKVPRSRFEAPYSVRISASRPAGGQELDIHFVNYLREEPPKSKDGRPSAGRGIVDEKPIAVAGVGADILLPAGWRARRIEAMTPEDPNPVELAMQAEGGRVRFTMPQFLVYGVARIYLEKAD